MNGLPTWAKVVATIGIPGAIAFALLYLLIVVATPTASDLREHRLNDERVMRLLRSICLNTARDSTERAACWN